MFLVPLVAWNVDLLQLLTRDVKRHARNRTCHKSCRLRFRRIRPSVVGTALHNMITWKVSRRRDSLKELTDPGYKRTFSPPSNSLKAIANDVSMFQAYSKASAYALVYFADNTDRKIYADRSVHRAHCTRFEVNHLTAALIRHIQYKVSTITSKFAPG